MNTPLPCPFCGSTNITIEWEPLEPLDVGDTNRRWFAECAQCSCQGPFCQKEPQVIDAWNNRKSDEARRLREMENHAIDAVVFTHLAKLLK